VNQDLGIAEARRHLREPGCELTGPTLMMGEASLRSALH
jgi:hypothetical protein